MHSLHEGDNGVRLINNPHTINVRLFSKGIKRGEAPLFISFPLSFKGEGNKGCEVDKQSLSISLREMCDLAYNKLDLAGVSGKNYNKLASL